MSAMTQPGPVPPESVRRLFEPASIALVGASDRSLWTRNTLASLDACGYTGELHLVNPRSAEAWGRPTAPSVAAIGSKVDVAYLMVPQDAVAEALEEAADAGVGGAVILTSGFAEAGAAGVERQRRLTEVAERHGVAVLGPNTLGYLNMTRRVCLYPSATNSVIIPGPVALVSQSGALGSVMFGFFEQYAVGLSLAAATGNEAVVTVTDVVDYLVDDDATRRDRHLRRIVPQARGAPAGRGACS